MVDLIKWHTDSITSLKVLKVILRMDVPSDEKVSLLEELLGEKDQYNTLNKALFHANGALLTYLTACYKTETVSGFLEDFKRRLLGIAPDAEELPRENPRELTSEQKQNFYHYYVVDFINVDSYAEKGKKDFLDIARDVDPSDDAVRNAALADLFFAINMYLKIYSSDTPGEEKLELVDKEFEATTSLWTGLVGTLAKVFDKPTVEALDAFIEKTEEALKIEQAKLV